MSAYLLGSATQRSVGKLGQFVAVNRSQTAAEHLALYRAGVPYADVGASSVNRYSGDSTNFEGGTVGSWVANTNAPTSLAVNAVSPISGVNDLLCVSTTSTNSGFNFNIGTITSGVKYRITLKYKAESGSAWTLSLREGISGASATPSVTTLGGSNGLTSDGTIRLVSWEFRPNVTNASTRLLFKNTAGVAQSIQIDDFALTLTGVTASYLPSLIQLTPGQ